jgi:hypothetical protein
MYTILLYLHSWLRWAVLLFALIVIAKSFSGWFGRKDYTSSDNKLATFYIASVHSQFLIGLLLYIFFSPITKAAFADFGAAMKNSGLRFFAVEHITGMVIAVVLAQVGRSLSKKAKDAVTKHKKLAIFATISLVIMLATIPWPAMRPLFRF